MVPDEESDEPDGLEEDWGLGDPEDSVPLDEPDQVPDELAATVVSIDREATDGGRPVVRAEGLPSEGMDVIDDAVRDAAIARQRRREQAAQPHIEKAITRLSGASDLLQLADDAVTRADMLRTDDGLFGVSQSLTRLRFELKQLSSGLAFLDE